MKRHEPAKIWEAARIRQLASGLRSRGGAMLKPPVLRIAVAVLGSVTLVGGLARAESPAPDALV
ncbi:MAG TPA: hypothetical protein VKQ32_00045, partial [Polyangia bacterium]|nr:hypothetical protein [Polyangia bacterium]